MEFLRRLKISALDFFLRGIPGYTEKSIIILLG
jgi:hypothetical protein